MGGEPPNRHAPTDRNGRHDCHCKDRHRRGNWFFQYDAGGSHGEKYLEQLNL